MAIYVQSIHNLQQRCHINRNHEDLAIFANQIIDLSSFYPIRNRSFSLMLYKILSHVTYFFIKSTAKVLKIFELSKYFQKKMFHVRKMFSLKIRHDVCFLLRILSALCLFSRHRMSVVFVCFLQLHAGLFQISTTKLLLSICTVSVSCPSSLLYPFLFLIVNKTAQLLTKSTLKQVDLV